MKSLRMTIVIFSIFVFFTGCTSTQYLDQPTPPGTVAPSRVPQPVDAQNSALSPVDTYRKIQQEEIPITPSKNTVEDSNKLKDDFTMAYGQQGKPRMTIFLNRYLSDQIKNWSSNSRFVATGNGSYKVANSKNAKLKNTSDLDVVNTLGTLDSERALTISGNQKKSLDIAVNNGSLVLTSQRKNRLGGERSTIVEANMWKVESGFVQTFLEVNAVIVDRSSIMRMMALEKDTKELMGINEKSIEMSALKQYSDIYIELLVNNTQSNFVFKAIAKEIDTGRIIGLATTKDTDFENEDGPKTYVATATGFQAETSEDKSIEEIAAGLGCALMKSLTNTWQSN